MDSEQGIIYRLAYACARDRLAERPTAHRSVADIDALRAAILAELDRDLEHGDEGATIVRAAVEDALAGRRPRW
jgi:hypothetical protein